MKIELVRLEYSEDGTFGIIKINNRSFCCTAELPWRHNQQNISCIPEGLYYCKRIKTSSGRITFNITDVEGRTEINFDVANRPAEVLGCIAIGDSFGEVYKERAVLNSSKTMKKFLTALEQYDELMLTIQSV